MLEQLKYQNHLNEVFEFGKSGIFVNMSDVHDYEWDVTSKGNRITAMKRGIGKRKLPVIIICEDEAAGITAKNRMLEVMEKDVLALQHGRIIVGDYYFRCYVTASKKSNYLTAKRYMEAELTLTSDFPFWVKETTTMFRKIGEGTSGSDSIDFPHDFPFDYHSGTINKTLDNQGFVPTDFKMVIHGACTDPTVYISGHAYSVTCKLEANEYLTIDSTKKTVTKTANDGTATNLFNSRNKESYIFEKIPMGANTVRWEGDYGIDITLLEERSEPKWT